MKIVRPPVGIITSPIGETRKQRMQTAPAGTYKGMLDCATGILKNEGPLAFYKVWCAPVSCHTYPYAHLLCHIPTALLSNLDVQYRAP